MWQQWEMDRIQQYPLHRLVYVVENKKPFSYQKYLVIPLRNAIPWFMDICEKFYTSLFQRNVNLSHSP